MTSYIFWGITPCSPLNINRHLGGKSHLHYQGRRESQERNQHEAGSNQTLMMEAAFYSEMSVGFLSSCMTLIPEVIISHFLFISKFLSLSSVTYLLNI
jgi:hypothetical protein